jgi:dimethylargininase
MLVTMTYPWGRKLVASALSAFVIALVVHIGNIVGITLGYVTSGAGWASFTQLSDFFGLASVFTLILLFVAGIAGAYRWWWSALLAGLVVGLIAVLANGSIAAAAQGGGSTETIANYLWNSIAGQSLLYIALLTALTPTFGRYLYRVFGEYKGARPAKYALVRVPASNLADGLVTHIEKSGIDSALADEQWDAYVAALVENGWQTVEVAPADTLPDSVFVEDPAIVFGDLAVIARSGAESRRGEADAVETSLREQGLAIERIEEPGTLDGGDVLQVGTTVYVGRSTRTNPEGIRQLRSIVTPLGYTVIAVPVTRALHLKTAVTALPDGTVIGHPDLVDDPGLFDRFLAVPETEGAAIVVLDDATVLMSAAAPQSAALIADLGYRVVTVDISEFEKLEGCVTCLSIRVA